MIEKIYIDKTLSCKQLMQKYNIARTTAFDVKKRGYVAKRTKLINISRKAFDYEKAKGAARHIFFKRIRYMFRNPLDIFDDLQQEAILRCFELSGESKENKKNERFNHYCKVAEYAMYSFLEKQQLLGPLKGRICSFEENVLEKGIYEI